MANEKLGVAAEPSPESLWGLCICAVELDILKFEQTSLFYSASYFNLGGAWSFVSEGLSPPKHPPMATGLCVKTSACFLMQLTRKSTYVMRYVKLARYVKLSVYKHDRAQSDTTHSGGVYSAS